MDEKQKVSEMLRELGVPAHLAGYRYLQDSILLAARESVTGNMTKMLYPLIAEKFSVTDKQVERSIRSAIETAWLRGEVETQRNYFGCSVNPLRGKPSNSHFIATLAERLSFLPGS